MKTDIITVTNKEESIKEALFFTEKFGNEVGLEKKGILHLRLLSEELMGILRGIAGDIETKYWIENDNKKVELHMKSEVKMSGAMREQFLAASSSGKNEATRSFVGKIRTMIADVLLSAKENLPYAMMNTASAAHMGNFQSESASVWSMVSYKDEVRKHTKDNKEAKEAWDELEKSIVANLADDVKVKIIGNNVEIVVYKSF